MFRFSIGSRVTSCPSMATEPSSGASSPRMHRNRVLFPPPDGPMIVTSSPFSARKLTPRRTSRSPSRLETPFTSIPLKNEPFPALAEGDWRMGPSLYKGEPTTPGRGIAKALARGAQSESSVALCRDVTTSSAPRWSRLDRPVVVPLEDVLPEPRHLGVLVLASDCFLRVVVRHEEPLLDVIVGRPQIDGVPRIREPERVVDEERAGPGVAQPDGHRVHRVPDGEMVRVVDASGADVALRGLAGSVEVGPVDVRRCVGRCVRVHDRREGPVEVLPTRVRRGTVDRGDARDVAVPELAKTLIACRREPPAHVPPVGESHVDRDRPVESPLPEV